MITSWFKKNKIEVPDLEKIRVSPKIEVPEKTRRELYEGAVRQVDYSRVRELIKREIMELGSCPINNSQTREVISKYGNKISEVLAVYINKNYPTVHLEPIGNDSGGYRVVRGPNIHTLIDKLTQQYLKEDLNVKPE